MAAIPNTGTDERYAAQHAAGFPRLRFAPDLEQEYRRSYLQDNVLRIRLAVAVAIGGVLGFFFVDHVLGVSLEPAYADWLLALVTIPAMLVPLAATFRPNASPRVLHFLLAGVLLTVLSALYAINLGRAANPWFSSGGLYLALMFTYFVSGLMFQQALFAGLLFTACFVISNRAAGEGLLYETYLLLLANALGAIGHYMLERQSRLGWLMKNELRQQAALDSVTGQLTRRAFNQRLATAWSQAQREMTSLGLLLVDLDHFKKVNDSAGHPFGDAALHHVGEVLRQTTKRPLDAVGRFGGDELIALWYGIDGASLSKLAEELPGRIRLQGGDPAHPVRITISGGAVLAWPRPTLDLQTAIKTADDLLYEVKRSQRGAIRFQVLRGPAEPPRSEAA